MCGRNDVFFVVVLVHESVGRGGSRGEYDSVARNEQSGTREQEGVGVQKYVDQHAT